jgi:hypothetical protein
VLPIIIIAAVVVPLLVITFLTVRRSRTAGEHPAGEDEATQLEYEREFAAAERYEEEWRAREHEHP